jgi:hypothetical protein
LRRVGDRDPPLIREAFLDVSIREMDRWRDRPRKVADSPEGSCAVVIVR